MYITKRSNPNGSLAVYETECKRVPEYPYPRQFKTCIGKKVAGEFIPNRFYLEREEKRKLASELETLKSATKQLKQKAKPSALTDLVGIKRRQELPVFWACCANVRGLLKILKQSLGLSNQNGFVHLSII